MADTETTNEVTPTTEPTAPKTEIYPDFMDGEDPDGVDVDLQLLKEAEAEAAREESGEAPPAEPATDPVAPAPAPAAAPTEPAPAATTGEQPMIPKARFDEVNNARIEAERALAFREGQLAAAQQQPAPASEPPAEPPPPAPDFAAKQQEARDRHKEVARRYDNGEITMEEVEESRFRMGAELDEIDRSRREHEAAAAQPAQPAQQPMTADEAAKVFTDAVSQQAQLNAHAIQLNQQHPYLLAITPQDMPLIQAAVVRELAEAGTPIVFDNSPQQTIRLREAIAQKIDRMGPTMYPNFDPNSVTQPPSPSGPTSQPTAQPALSPQAKARQDKLNLAADHPPDTTQVGSQGGHQEVTEQQILNMSDDEIAALPAHLQDKYLQ